MATQRFLLKVLNGMYKDSELPLQSGEYSFGSAVENDISIEDTNLQPQEGKILVADGISVALGQFDRPIYVGGKPHSELNFSLDNYVPVYLGDFCFAVGLEGEQWPQMDLGKYDPEPEVPQEDSSGSAQTNHEEQGDEESLASSQAVEQQSAEEPSDDEDLENADDDEDDLSLIGEEEEVNEFDPEEQETDGLDSENDSKRTKKVAIAAVAVIVLVVGSFVAHNIWQVQKEIEVQMEEARTTNEERIREVVLNAGAGIELREAATASGNPRVVGYVATEKDLARLVSDLDEAGAVYQLEVFVTEQMILAGYSLLNAFSFKGIEIKAGSGSGTLIARGYIEDVDRWKKIKGVIERDIEGLLTLVDQVETPSVRYRKLEESIARAGLEGQVKLFLAPEGMIFARTSLSVENEQKWKILEDVFKKSFGNQPRLVTLVDDKNWLKIIAINFTGPVPYMVLADGRKYTEGSNLDNGYKLKEINENGVVLLGQFGERVMPIRLDQ